MCIAIERRHIECHHVKSLEVRSPCLDALRAGLNCPQEQWELLKELITAPALCVPCYRKTEKEIFDEAEVVRARITKTLKNTRRAVEHPSVNAETKEDMRRLIRKLEGLKKANRNMRNVHLVEFRQEQGVWGDG